MSDYLTTRQAAGLMGVGESTVKRMCNSNALATIRTEGGHRRIPATQVNQWLIDQRQSQRCDSAAVSIQTGRPIETTLDDFTPEDIVDCLRRGAHRSLLSIVQSAISSGTTTADVIDNALAPAMWLVGQRWYQGTFDVYEEHLCSRNMRALLVSLRDWAAKRAVERHSKRNQSNIPRRPRAIGCSIGGEQHDLASTMIEWALVDLGWDAQSLGSSVPVDSLINAILMEQPILVWVSYTHSDNANDLVLDNHHVHQSLGNFQRLAVGGQALSIDLRRELLFDFAGNSMGELCQFASELPGELKRAV